MSTKVVSIRIDQELADVLAALGRGRRGIYLRQLLEHHVRERRRGCQHDRHCGGRCADCGLRLRPPASV